MLDPQYVIAPSLEMYFVNKVTGLPLAGGKVKFFSNTNRSTPKLAYKLSGNPSNYTYSPLPAVITLSSVGTFQDGNGNNIVPYYYPYDNQGNIELYYIEVYDANDLLQFTREAWPNAFAPEAQPAGANIPNFIPNGQFRAHNNITADVVNGNPSGLITQPVTEIAAGGWTFERPSGSSSTDLVDFVRFSSYTSNPAASPRYVCRVRCTSQGGDLFKYLAVKFNDVNKFSSNTDQYTFSFSSAVTSGSATVGLYLVKYFGAGGSPTEVTQLTTFTLTTQQTLFQHSFVFGSNAGKFMGTSNDDYVQLAIGFPTSSTFDIRSTNFVLQSGNIATLIFPATTDRDFFARTYATRTPQFDNSSLGLPLIITKDGLTPDDSIVGTIVLSPFAYAPVGYIKMDGESIRTDGKYSDGVPCSRLQAKLVTAVGNNNATDGNGLPIFGTGKQYVTCTWFDGHTSWFFFATNQKGAQTISQDGANPTGFDIREVCHGWSSPFSGLVFGDGDATYAWVWAVCNSAGIVPEGTTGAGNSGLLMTTVPNPEAGEVIGTSSVAQRVYIKVPSIPNAGTYLLLGTPTQAYYLWFQVNGGGVDPAVGGIGIKCNLVSSMNRYDVAYAIACAISGFQLTAVNPLPVNSIPQSSYFEFHANSKLYYVWCDVDQGGTDPALAGGIGIRIGCQTGNDASAVRSSGSRAINRVYYCAKDLSGLVVKGYPNGTNPDKNAFFRYDMLRWGYSPNDMNNMIGSSQLDYISDHTHQIPRYVGFGPDEQIDLEAATFSSPSVGSTVYNPSLRIANNGTAQTDVQNTYLQFLMKY